MTYLNNPKQDLPHRTCGGFTLIELMITVAIIAIIASIAINSYQDSIIKSKRKAGMAMLYEIASSQEEYFINQKGYAVQLSLMGYSVNGTSAAPLYIDENGSDTAAADASYKVFINDGVTTASYRLSAEPVNAQASDTHCGTLSLDSTGARAISGSATVAECFR